MRSLKIIFNCLKTFATEHSNEIILGAQIATAAVASLFAVRATVKSVNKIREEEEKTGEKVKPLKAVKMCAGNYVPCAAFLGFNTYASIKGYKNIKTVTKELAIATVTANAAKIMCDEYKDIIKECKGEEELKEIQKKIERNLENTTINKDVVASPVVFFSGEYIFVDENTKCRMLTTKNKLDAIANELNKKIYNGDYITQDDLYYELNMNGRAGKKAQNRFFTYDCKVEFDYKDPYIDDDGAVVIPFTYEYVEYDDRIYP